MVSCFAIQYIYIVLFRERKKPMGERNINKLAAGSSFWFSVGRSIGRIARPTQLTPVMLRPATLTVDSRSNRLALPAERLRCLIRWLALATDCCVVYSNCTPLSTASCIYFSFPLSLSLSSFHQLQQSGTALDRVLPSSATLRRCAVAPSCAVRSFHTYRTAGSRSRVAASK